MCVGTGSIRQIDQSEGSLSVLDVNGDQVVFSRSLIDTPSSLIHGQLSADSRSVQLSPVLERQPIPPSVPSLKKHIFDLTAEIKDSVSKLINSHVFKTNGPTTSINLPYILKCWFT